MLLRWLARLSVLVIAVALAGCPSLAPQADLPPSVDRVRALEHSGDLAGAARVLEQLAAQNSGSDRNTYLLHAAHDYLAAHLPEDAARVLARPEGTLSDAQATEKALLEVSLSLERGQALQASHQFAQIPVPADAALAAQYHELQARIAQPSARPAPGVAAPHAAPAGRAGNIALLLPVTGRATAAASSVRDGFMTALYQLPAAERPEVRVYDTGTLSVADALKQASAEGAAFIVGPLKREEVTAAAELAGARPPVLALNYLAAEHSVPPEFYQFALSPENEARLAARRILEDHHRRGVAFVPSGEWGTRVLAAFKQELLAGGGDLIAVGQIDLSRTDFSPTITEVLRISDSNARHKRLESILGTKLNFEPRRRTDIEFIFSPAQAPIERQLRPQLRFHYAGDIPAYATSDAFEPDMKANEDLDGLMFPDMPWILGGDLPDAVRAATHEAWPSGGPNRGRLFAFGFDAFRLTQALGHRGVAGNVNVDGLTGRLSLDEDRRVHREMGWAQLHNGELRLLPPTAQ
jgi:outer membrane PBP1 activator LpoA protein